MNIQQDPEWDRLAEHGYISDYVHMHGTDPRICSPIITLEEALKGWFPKGTKVKWHPNAGWPHQEQKAQEVIGPDRILTVKACSIGSSSSYYEFDEVEGVWNTVMFEKVEDNG